MNGWIITILSLALLLVAFISAVGLAWIVYENIRKIRTNRIKKALSNKCRYQCYFLSERELKEDLSATKLAAISYHGYTDSIYEQFYRKLDVERLPINVLVNWTKTIVEDLLSSVSPINHVQDWDSFFESGEYRDYANMSVHPDFVAFEEHELAYLWGAVYYWLRTFVSNFDNEELLGYIERVACKKHFLRPYFYQYKNLAEGRNDSVESYCTPNVPNATKALTAEQTALLWLAIATLIEKDVAKKSLAPTISKITGVGVASIKSKIVGSFKEEDKRAVASLFEDTMPNLAAKIMKM